MTGRKHASSTRGGRGARSMTDDPARFEVKTTGESHFSWLRTRLSVERTLMSWVRTAVALIGFGFTSVQFFERLPAISGVAPALLPEAPPLSRAGADRCRRPVVAGRHDR